MPKIEITDAAVNHENDEDDDDGEVDEDDGDDDDEDRIVSPLPNKSLMEEGGDANSAFDSATYYV